jgi:ornithine decarboxylase
MTFDCEEELYKIAEVFPEAECILRIATDPSTALCQLSEKYGAPM